MKTFLLLALLAGCLYCWHRNSQKEAAAAAQPQVAQTAPAPNAPGPAASRSPSSWHKRSIDRAHDVASDVRKSRENFSDDE